MKVQPVALGFERHGEALVRRVPLGELGLDDFRFLFELETSDPVIGASFPISNPVRKWLEQHVSRQLDPDLDWFATFEVQQRSADSPEPVFSGLGSLLARR